MAMQGEGKAAQGQGDLPPAPPPAAEMLEALKLMKGA